MKCVALPNKSSNVVNLKNMTVKHKIFLVNSSSVTLKRGLLSWTGVISNVRIICVTKTKILWKKKNQIAHVAGTGHIYSLIHTCYGLNP